MLLWEVDGDDPYAEVMSANFGGQNLSKFCICPVYQHVVVIVEVHILKKLSYFDAKELTGPGNRGKQVTLKL